MSTEPKSSTPESSTTDNVRPERFVWGDDEIEFVDAPASLEETEEEPEGE